MTRIQEFDFSVDLEQSLLWQYNTAPQFESLITQKQAWYDLNVTGFLNDWYTNVFNLRTANDFGLAVWSIILGLPLFIDLVPDPPGKLLFGFSDDGTFDNGYYNFDRGYFTNTSGNNAVLTTEEKRLVLRVRYFQLSCRGAIPLINSFLTEVFAEAELGGVYALDGLDMSMAYVFLFGINPVLLQVFQEYDILPRPESVKIKYVEPLRMSFGFSDDGTFDNGYYNFDRGTFNG